MEIFRPRCSAAVRHQVRLEMLLGLVPTLCTLSVILAAVAGELKNSNYTAVLLLHVVLLLVVIGIGLWMKVNNSLDSFVHYLEDTQRSNDLLVACSWAPLLLHLVPMLFIGDANGLTDTYMTVIGYFLLYVPVLDTPYYSFVSYAAYSCLACIRILQLRPTEGVPVSGFFVRTVVLGIFGKVALRTRLWHLSKSRTPLTPQALSLQSLQSAAGEPGACGESSMDASREPYNPMHANLRRRPLQVCRVSDGFMATRGGAARIHLSILRRRQQDKELLIGQFLWAVHFFRANALAPDSLVHILSFVDCTRSDTNYVGLLHDDASSQVSSRQDRESSTHATSSLTSVSALRHDLATRLGRLLRPHLDSVTKLSSPPIATVKEEEVDVYHTWSPAASPLGGRLQHLLGLSA